MTQPVGRPAPARIPDAVDLPVVGNGGDPFLAAGGAMGTLMRQKDWSGTPLGDPAGWPQSLKSVIQLMLNSRYAMWMGWGGDLLFFYNDAYAPTLGVKHPWALGVAAREVWAEIWPEIGPRIDRVIREGVATYDEGLLLLLERSGYPEETYHTFSYSPLPQDAAGHAGMFCVVTEETDRVISERRLRVMRELSAAMAGTRTRDDVLTAAAACLERHPHDLPFTLIYLQDGSSDQAKLVCSTGLRPGHPAAPEWLPVSGAGTAWPIGAVMTGAPGQTVPGLADRFADLPRGPWARPPQGAFIMPIAQQGQDRPAGVFIAGLNPHRRLGETYRGFLDLLVGQIGAALANAGAYEEERRRAEALAEIDRAKTAFFSNVSHEFRTPLTLMLSPLEELLAQPAAQFPPRAMPLVDIAYRNAVRLLKLVNALLDFSRIEAGRAQASYVATDLAALTADLAAGFRSACERAGLTLVVDCTPLPSRPHVDRDMWEKIVLNLLSNAFKFTLTGGITVTLRERDGQAALVVRDTGSGIPEHELPRLFERFHRVEGVVGRSIEGSGIGLALVQELVALHGGTIQVDSEVGVGSAFTVTIPQGTAHLPADRVRADAPATASSDRAQSYVEEALRWLPQADDATAAQPLPKGIAAEDARLAGQDRLRAEPITATADATGPTRPHFLAPGHPPPRVLLADDNADMRAYVRRLLSHDGYIVTTAVDGQEALQAALDDPPDLVLADVMMPGLDGFELLRGLRADPTTRDLPVVLLSARAGEEAKIEGMQAGADDYVVKPFAARELLARVGTILQMAALRRQTATTLREMNQQLAARVIERTAALEAQTEERLRIEAQLRQSQKMEAVGQLTGGVAHDFNNLLTVVLGGLETISNRLSAAPSPQDLARMRRSADAATQGAQRAATLTHRLLAFSRQQSLAPQNVDINKLVFGMAELLRRTLGESVALETVLAGGLWRTFADPNQLENAILNLAVNARDAMPGGGRLTLETSNAHLDEAYVARNGEALAPGQYVSIAVTDTGTGMSPATIERAFEPFFTTKDVGQGTGLGLSQVYGFVKQSRGHVAIYSEPGQGSTVRIYLPRLVGDAAELPVQDAAARTAVAGAAETILLVEDSDAVRSYSAEVLRELGYHVIEATDAAAALACLNQHPNIRMLFSDIGLPGGTNGCELAEQAVRLRPGLRVLLTSGYAPNAIFRDGSIDPTLNLINKPFTAADLSARIRRILDGPG